MLTMNSKKTSITTILNKDNPIEHVTEFKYRGDIINSNANNKSLISQRTKKFTKKYWGLLLYVKRYVKYEMHVLIRS